MKLIRSLQVALLGAVLFTSALAQTEADIASLLPKAQRGNAIAQYRLGVAYSTGQGVAANPIEAYIWLSLAYENGFRGKALGNVAGALDSTQLEAARAQLAERRASLNQKPAATPATEAEIPVVRTSPAPQAAPASPAPAANPALAQELAAAITDKQQLSGELSKSWAETEELKKQLTETQATADFLTNETSKLRAERDALAAKQDEFAKESATLRTERDHARGLGEQAELTLAQANSQKAALESSLKAAQAGAATDKKWLSDELTKSFQEVSALKTQLATQTKALTSVPAAPAYPDLTGKVKELEASLAALVTEANATKQEAARLADDRIAREKQLVALQQQSAGLANKNTLLQQESDKLRQAAATPAAPTYPDLREQVASLENQLATLKAQTGQQITGLTQAKESAEKSLAQRLAIPATPDLTGKVRELEASLAAVTSEANTAKQEAARLADDRIEREKQLITLQQQSAGLADKNAALQQESDKLRQAATTPATPSYPDLRAQFAAQEKQLSALKTDAAQARDQIAVLTQAKTAAEKSLAQTSAAPAYPDLTGKVRELEASLAALTTEANNTKQEAARLADDRIEREKQLIALQQQSAALTDKNTLLQQESEKLRRATANPAAPAYPDLRESFAAQEKQLSALKSEANQAREQITALTQAKTTAEKSLAQVSTAPVYPDLSGKVRELEVSVAALTTEANTTKQEAARLADDRIEREKQLIALQQQVATLAQAKEAAEKAPAQGANAPAYPDLSGKVQELTTSIVNLNSEANATAKTAEALRQAKIEAEQKLAAVDQARTELARQFDEFKRSALTNQREQLSVQSKIQMLESEKAALRQQTAADQTRLADLSSQLAASRRQATEVYPTSPSYPDQRARVEQLEAELTKTNEQANSMVTLLNHSQQEAKESNAQAEQLRATIRTLENKIAAVDTTPAYPDLRNQVASLESELKAAKSAAPAYPDLREQVGTLEIQLEAARNLPKLMVPAAEHSKIKQELADTKEKLGTTLRGYAVLEKERDEFAKRPAAPASAPAPAYPDLRSQVASLEAALQRATAQYERDLAAARTQTSSASIPAVAAQPAPQPKAVTAAEIPVGRPVTKPAVVVPASVAPTQPVVVSAPAPVAVRRTHVVTGGDSLVKLSQRYYGTDNRWRDIYNANRDVIGTNGALRAGTELRIP